MTFEPDGLKDPQRETVVGPTLASVMQRIGQAPPDCVLAPGRALSTIDAAAVVADALAVLAPHVPQDTQLLERVRAVVVPVGAVADDLRPRAAVLTTWVLLDPGVHAAPALARDAADLDRSLWVLTAIHRIGVAFAPVVDPAQWPSTPATREEAARAILRAAGLHPAYETSQSADARWQTVSTAVQQRVLVEMALEARRAEELAAELARTRAREAAAQVSNV